MEGDNLPEKVLMETFSIKAIQHGDPCFLNGFDFLIDSDDFQNVVLPG